VSAHATFIVVVVGYLTDSFEDDCKTSADDRIIRSTGHCLRSILQLCRRPFASSRLEASKDDATLEKNSSKAADAAARRFRIDAVRDFMLALSDQQLVTGVAMLVAAFGRWSSITTYSANVVAALAYFSSSVHMGTLDFLTTYLRRHDVVKGCRVVAMLLTVLMLVFFLALQLSDGWYVVDHQSNLFVKCAFQDFQVGDSDGITWLPRLYVIALLVYAHYDKIAILYSKHGRAPQGISPIVAKRMRKYKIDRIEPRSVRYKRRAQRLIVQPPSLRRSVITWMMVESYAFHEAQESRAWDIASLLYANVVGAVRVFFYRNSSEGTSGPFNTMGFGQIVPVFLLVLLIFAAVESVYGNCAGPHASSRTDWPLRIL
jgi:hypothetical protein